MSRAPCLLWAPSPVWHAKLGPSGLWTGRCLMLGLLLVLVRQVHGSWCEPVLVRTAPVRIPANPPTTPPTSSLRDRPSVVLAVPVPRPPQSASTRPIPLLVHAGPGTSTIYELSLALLPPSLGHHHPTSPCPPSFNTDFWTRNKINCPATRSLLSSLSLPVTPFCRLCLCGPSTNQDGCSRAFSGSSPRHCTTHPAAFVVKGVHTTTALHGSVSRARNDSPLVSTHLN